jgi:hypothetical protein
LREIADMSLTNAKPITATFGGSAADTAANGDVFGAVIDHFFGAKNLPTTDSTNIIAPKTTISQRYTKQAQSMTGQTPILRLNEATTAQSRTPQEIENKARAQLHVLDGAKREATTGTQNAASSSADPSRKSVAGILFNDLTVGAAMTGLVGLIAPQVALPFAVVSGAGTFAKMLGAANDDSTPLPLSKSERRKAMKNGEPLFRSTSVSLAEAQRRSAFAPVSNAFSGMMSKGAGFGKGFSESNANNVIHATFGRNAAPQYNETLATIEKQTVQAQNSLNAKLRRDDQGLALSKNTVEAFFRKDMKNPTMPRLDARFV